MYKIYENSKKQFNFKTNKSVIYCGGYKTTNIDFVMNLQIGEAASSIKNVTKSLGIVLDNKLKFGEHVNNLIFTA